jgi:hypothetical protein
MIQTQRRNTNYRSVGGPTPYPEDQKMLDPQEPVFGGRFDADAYNNGGMWLKSVFHKSGITKNNNNNDTNWLIGFYHAADHWYPRTRGDEHYSWKSMGAAISLDNGTYSLAFLSCCSFCLSVCLSLLLLSTHIAKFSYPRLYVAKSGTNYNQSRAKTRNTQ